MTSSISSSTSAAPATPLRSHHDAKRRDEMKTLAQDVKSGDMAGAQKAYAELTKNVPASVLSNPNSALGQLGAALNAGDADAAKVAMAKVAAKIHDVRQATSGPSANPVPAPVTTSSSGGTAGSLVNVVA